MFGQPCTFPKSSPTEEQCHAAFQAVSAPSAVDASPGDCAINGMDDLLVPNGTGAKNGGDAARTTAAATMRASAPPPNDEAAADGNGGGPPRAKRARAGSTPLIAGGSSATAQQRTTTGHSGTTSGSGRTSRESGAESLANSAAAFLLPPTSQQQSPMDLMSVLQALAASAPSAGAITAASSPTVASAFGTTSNHCFSFGSAATANAISGASTASSTTTDADSFLMAAAAMATNAGGTAVPPTPGTTGTAPSLLPPQLSLPLTPSATTAVAAPTMPSAVNNGNNNSFGSGATNGSSNAPSPSPQKRARTRIADEQVKILRQYFDINNSPSEEQIKEMAHKAQLPEKVIKHWFRNTLFKERQRDKDSPYNFSIPPQMGIDLATYHRTGEARIIPVGKGGGGGGGKNGGEGRKNEGEEEEEEHAQQEEEEENGIAKPNSKKEQTTTEREEKKSGERGEEAMEEDNVQHQQQQQENEEGEEKEKGEREEEEVGMTEDNKEEEEEEEEEHKLNQQVKDEHRAVDEDERHRHGDEASDGDEAKPSPNSALVDPANFLASLGNPAAQQPMLMPPLFPFFGTGAGNTTAPSAGATGVGMESFASMFSAFPFHPFGQLAPAASASSSTSNGFSSPSAAHQQQQHSAFLQPTTAGLMAAAAAAAGTNNGAFGHLFSGQNLLMNSLMGQNAGGGIGTGPTNSVPSSSQLGGVPCSSSSSSSASVPPSSATTVTAAGTSMGSGRRANRTRFTDFQLRTLQQFFDKQAYPKDDDLEMLSKKMGLSPRVIVVWFQNARQKARKVFEQQPHLLMQANLTAAASGANDLPAADEHNVNNNNNNNNHHILAHQQQQHYGHGHGTNFGPFNNTGGANNAFVQQQRFVRTPSANFQCVRCKLVFQRYLELVQHQQRACFAGDEPNQQHQQPSDSMNNTSYSNETPLSLVDEPKQHHHHNHGNSIAVGSTAMTTTSGSSNCNTTSAATDPTAAATMMAMEQSTQELLRQLVAAHCHQTNNNNNNNNGNGNNNLGGTTPIADATAGAEDEDGADDEHQQHHHHHDDDDDDQLQQQEQQQETKDEAECTGPDHYCAVCDRHFECGQALQTHRCHSHPPTGHNEDDDDGDKAAASAGTMPKAKESAAAGGSGGEPLDLSVSSSAVSRDDWMMMMMMMPTGATTTTSNRSCGANSLSPTAFSMSEDGGGCANEQQQYQQLQYASGGATGGESQVCSPLDSYCSTSAAGTAMLPSSSTLLFHSSHQSPTSSNNYGNSMGAGNGSGADNHHNSNSSSINGNSSANKRHRTHLTPMQIFVMKTLFNDYKTPSMVECKKLGEKIGLHQRVVQVWFQNARAKERKCAGGSSTGSGAESSDDTAVTVSHCDLAGQRCHLCGVEFDARLSLQEHIFSAEHVERVREQGSQMRGISTGSVAAAVPSTMAQSLATDSASGGCEMEKQRVASADAAATDTPSKAATATATVVTTVQQQQQQQQIDAAAAMVAAQQFPYELMYAAAAASGLSPGALPSLLYDPAVFGTPVPALKIPKCVMQQILADMAQRREHTVFTQDGLELDELAAKVDASDFANAGTVDLEVGWGCTQCGNVFQQSEQLQNHQKLICLGADGIFRLIQTHYQCNRCTERFGTQDEFQAHCQKDGHKFKRENNTSRENDAAPKCGTKEAAGETD